MKKFKYTLLIITIVMTSSGLFWQRHAIACDLLDGNNDFVQIADNTFISYEINPDETSSLKAKIIRAQERVDSTFGLRKAKPRILITSSVDIASQFKTNATGSSFRSFTGKQCIVLGPKGQNVDVIAHELVHAELAERLSFINNITEIPVWFNEGVGLIVDYREPFLPQNITLSKKQIDQVKSNFFGFQFFDGANVHQNYLAARLAVNHLKPRELYSMLTQIESGKSFKQVVKL